VRSWPLAGQWRESLPRELCYNIRSMSWLYLRLWTPIAAVILCVAVVTGTGWAQTSQLSNGRDETILVLPFENNSKLPSVDWLGEALAEVTVERLQDREFNVLSRQERLAVLEKMGLPDSARFSHATIVKVAGEADADEVIFGKFTSDGTSVTMEARLLRMSPARLSATLTQSGPLSDLLRMHARLTWQLLCALNEKNCLRESANRDETSFTEPPPSLRPDVLENFVRGLTGTDDEARIRALREAARLEPTWDRPAFELGHAYFARRDCESALPWFSHVPPGRPDGLEASFDAGVCHLTRNDAIRAEATFSGMLDRARTDNQNFRLPEFAKIHNNLGVARFALGRWNDAAAEFERAAAMDGTGADYRVNLALTKLAIKLPVAAVNPLEDARKIDPQDKGARALLVSTLEMLGRSADAAAVRAETPDGASAPAQPIPQDPAAIARLARVSRKLDPASLRPLSDEVKPGPPTSNGTRPPPAN
jgi:tetratricopeptide (TPR) repeat protein